MRLTVDKLLTLYFANTLTLQYNCGSAFPFLYAQIPRSSHGNRELVLWMCCNVSTLKLCIPLSARIWIYIYLYLTYTILLTKQLTDWLTHTYRYNFFHTHFAQIFLWCKHVQCTLGRIERIRRKKIRRQKIVQNSVPIGQFYLSLKVSEVSVMSLLILLI